MPPRRREQSASDAGSSDEFEEQLRDSESSSDDDGQQEWNAYCEACGGFDDLDSALRCASCPHQHHPACLTPEQRAARQPSPGGDRRRPAPTRQALRWACPQCTRRTRLGREVDKILAARGGGAGKEYRLKWVQRSYLHTEWVKLGELEDAGAAFPGLRRRLKAFDAKRAQLQAQPADTDLVDGVKPAWLEVERVIGERTVGGLAAAAGGRGKAHGEGGHEVQSGADGVANGAGGGPRRQFLCKWRELSYGECTWEEEADVEEHRDLIEQFRRRVPICELDLVAPPRPEEEEEVSLTADDDPVAALVGLAQLAEASTTAGGQGALTQRRFAGTPAFIQGELHPYQLEGLNWMYAGWESGTHLILADEMGLGKTVQAIAYLAALCHERVPRPHLVVVPLSTLPNWQREFARFAPHLNVVALAGNAEARAVVKEYELFGHGLGARTIQAAGRRREMLQRAVQFHVLLTSYEMVAAEEADLGKLEFESLVVDEGHRLKNKEARLFQALQGMRQRHRVLLTGTPLQNDLSELFMLLHFLEPQRFDSLEAFQSEFEDIAHEQQVERLHTLLRPHLLRRMKADVLRQLPPKKEQIVACELSGAQKKLYRSILTHSYESLTRGGVSKLKNVMMELRKAVQHVYLQFFPPAPRPVGQAWLQLLLEGSGKLALMDRMLQKLRSGGHRVLIYSQFLLMLDVLEWYCAARGFPFLRLDGSVATAERQRRIDAYNSQPDRHFIFLLSTRAGGLGINLATADTVILYDSDWNPHNDLQAQARAHRLGQESGVMVYRLIARNTVEERMMQRAKSKLVLEHVVVRKMKRKGGGPAIAGAPGEQQLDQTELQDLIRFGAAELFADEAAPEEAGAGEARAAPAKNRAVPTSVSERQAGRTGGQDGRVVVWTDDAVDQLLDRSELVLPQEGGEGGGDGGGGGGGGDILAGFKVAHFELKEQPAEAPGEASAAAEAAAAEAAAEQQAEAEAAAVLDAAMGVPAGSFWAELLAGRQDVVPAPATAALGKGKRQRRKVVDPHQDALLEALLKGASDSEASGSEGGSEGGEGGSQGSGSSDHVSDEDYRVGSDEEQEQQAEEEEEAAEWEQDGLVPEEREKRRRAAWEAGVLPAGQGQRQAAALSEEQQQGRLQAAALLEEQQQGQQEKGKRHRRTKAEMAVERGNYALAIHLIKDQGPRPPSGWPQVSGSGDQLRVWGFTRLQRHCFVGLVLQLGLESREDGTFEWGQLAAQFPTKEEEEVAKYGNLLMSRVMAAGKSSSGAFAGPVDGVPLNLLLCGHTAREILKQLGMLHIVRTSLLALDQPHSEAARAALRAMSRKGLREACTHWTAFNDVRLLQAVVKHGCGRWPEVLEDSDLGLQAPILAELSTMGFTESLQKPGPDATKEQERAYQGALRRPVQWLEARLERLAAALAQDPEAPDAPFLSQPMLGGVFGRNTMGRPRKHNGEAAAGEARPGAGRPHGSGGKPASGQEQGPGHGGRGQEQGQGREEDQATRDRERATRERERAERTAATIQSLEGVSHDSRQRRLQLHLLNEHMNRLSETIDRDSAEVHCSLTAQQPVDLVKAGQRFQTQLQGISNSSAKMLELLATELRSLGLGKGAEAGQPQQQQGQQPQQHVQQQTQQRAQQQGQQQQQAQLQPQQQHVQRQQAQQQRAQQQHAQPPHPQHPQHRPQQAGLLTQQLPAQQHAQQARTATSQQPRGQPVLLRPVHQQPALRPAFQQGGHPQRLSPGLQAAPMLRPASGRPADVARSDMLPADLAPPHGAAQPLLAADSRSLSPPLPPTAGQHGMTAAVELAASSLLQPASVARAVEARAGGHPAAEARWQAEAELSAVQWEGLEELAGFFADDEGSIDVHLGSGNAAAAVAGAPALLGTTTVVTTHEQRPVSPTLAALAEAAISADGSGGSGGSGSGSPQPLGGVVAQQVQRGSSAELAPELEQLLSNILVGQEQHEEELTAGTVEVRQLPTNQGPAAPAPAMPRAAAATAAAAATTVPTAAATAASRAGQQAQGEVQGDAEMADAQGVEGMAIDAA